VNHAELVGGAADAVPRLAGGAKGRKVIEGADLSALFGIDSPALAVAGADAGADAGAAAAPKQATVPSRRAKVTLEKTAKKVKRGKR